MEKCDELVENECSLKPTFDLKDNLDHSSCISENSKRPEKSVEDSNCNIEVVTAGKNATFNDTQASSSCSKGKNLSAHAGPNGYGLEINSAEKLSHLLNHILNSGGHENAYNPDSSSQISKVSSELSSEVSLEVNDKHCNHNNVENSEPSSDGTKSIPSPVNNSKKVKDSDTSESKLEYVSYESELQMPDIMRLIQKDLSEPYSIYTYRYFIHNWPKLCFLAMDGSTCVGAIVCKLDIHRKVVKRGYIAMLAVDENYRKRKIGSNLVLKAIRAMVADNADEVVLETEITNQPALRLYENLGFVRDKRLFRYYLNGVDALRLKLWLR